MTEENVIRNIGGVCIGASGVLFTLASTLNTTMGGIIFLGILGFCSLGVGAGLIGVGDN